MSTRVTSCTGTFTVELDGYDANATSYGHNVQLYTNLGAPSTPADWTLYHNSTSIAQGVALTMHNATVNTDTYYILARQQDASSDTNYKLLLDDGCDHSNSSNQPNQDLAPPVIQYVRFAQ